MLWVLPVIVRGILGLAVWRRVHGALAVRIWSRPAVVAIIAIWASRRLVAVHGFRYSGRIAKMGEDMSIMRGIGGSEGVRRREGVWKGRRRRTHRRLDWMEFGAHHQLRERGKLSADWRMGPPGVVVVSGRPPRDGRGHCGWRTENVALAVGGWIGSWLGGGLTRAY